MITFAPFLPQVCSFSHSSRRLFALTFFSPRMRTHIMRVMKIPSYPRHASHYLSFLLPSSSRTVCNLTPWGARACEKARLFTYQGLVRARVTLWQTKSLVSWQASKKIVTNERVSRSAKTRAKVSVPTYPHFSPRLFFFPSRENEIENSRDFNARTRVPRFSR